jgi:hypothetical protein
MGALAETPVDGVHALCASIRASLVPPACNEMNTMGALTEAPVDGVHALYASIRASLVPPACN